MEKKFKEAYLAGLIEFEELDALVSRWNFSDDNTLASTGTKRMYG